MSIRPLYSTDLSENRSCPHRARQRRQKATPPTTPNHLVLVVRADPIVCGHATEARNLAEAALACGLKSAHIVTYPIDILEQSGLPLKPTASITPYSEGIYVHRPEPVGNYKLLDGRLTYAMTGKLMELMDSLEGTVAIMDLYLTPHGNIVTSAIQSMEVEQGYKDAVTFGKAVGSDVTNVVRNSIKSGVTGPARFVLANYLAHDLPIAVSEYTRQQIVEAGHALDEQLGTQFGPRLQERVTISYPPVETAAYLAAEQDQEGLHEALARRGLKKDNYLFFLSRIARGKGVDDLIHAYRASTVCGKYPLVIYGLGPDLERVQGIAAGDEHIRFITDINDSEKAFLMHGAWSYLLPSKPQDNFIETFGIVAAEKMLAGGLGPVITTRTGGIPEATGDHCLYHTADDVASLRDCIEVANDMSIESKRALSVAARKYALQFDRINVFKELIGMTEQVPGSDPLYRMAS